MRVLLVEDDRMISAATEQALRDAAYAVDCVSDGGSAQLSVNTQQYDVILLDLGLPRLDGFHVLRHLRDNKINTPVLIITARDGLEDRIRGLDAGADDYVIKPFEMDELLARMRAVIRRHGGSSSPLLTNGAIQLDLASREISFEGATQRLSAREFSLMQSLMLRPGAILSRQDLEDRIYGWNEEVESNAVEYLIHSIRKKFGNQIIKNVRGLGWMVSKEK
ncbi:response regulator [Herbaspirillum robiniae]|uniref:Response regulator n=1 Tax=Herbaspirillum robiniae TaxID=2014887 RepID=A0A246WNQ9_9BURK|nr:response regulator [Herbaspirillum robiniae]NUU02366.1 response regulator [Herbaspirillum robiniae]OWY27612.1 DNA-binding response regulator [Herbaspirillum robiniae]